MLRSPAEKASAGRRTCSAAARLGAGARLSGRTSRLHSPELWAAITPEAAAIDRVVQRAREVALDAQPWPGQFFLRGAEMKALLSHVHIPDGARVLEIGCGNAVGSVFLAERAGFVVATDLPHADRETHSIGMSAPRRLLDRLDVQRCFLTAASAVSLPFAGESFDVALASFVLEHVPDKAEAVAELHRVLRPGGLAIAFVPNFIERLYAPLFFYVYLAKRVLARLRASRASAGSVSAHEEPRAERRSFRQTYPAFPLPNPHGTYDSSLEELRSHWPARWIQQLTAGGFEVVQRFYLMNLPANAAALVFGEAGMHAYDRLGPLDRALGGSGLGPWLGQYSCYVAKRSA